MGQSICALPRRSDVNLLRNGYGIVDFDAQVSHGALDLGVAEE